MIRSVMERALTPNPPAGEQLGELMWQSEHEQWWIIRVPGGAVAHIQDYNEHTKAAFFIPGKFSTIRKSLYNDPFGGNT